MKFKLVYNGEIKINPKHRCAHLHEIRTQLSPQLKRLTEIAPYDAIRQTLMNRKKCFREVGGAKFFPIITPELDLLAELDVQIMHPELLNTPHADIDNRMKTLLDALKRPQSANEVSSAMNKGETMFFLLDDDHLVTKMTINTSHLLARPEGIGRTKIRAHSLGAAAKPLPDYDLLIIISVNIKASRGTMDNLAVIV